MNNDHIMAAQLSKRFIDNKITFENWKDFILKHINKMSSEERSADLSSPHLDNVQFFIRCAKLVQKYERYEVAKYHIKDELLRLLEKFGVE